MKLLLVSLGLGALEQFLPSPATIGFIATAGEVYDDPWFVRNDRMRLSRLGYGVSDIDISQASKQEILDGLSHVDAIFVAGGSTFYLLQQIYAKGIENDLCSLVREGKPYIGASAGAAIVGPSLTPIETLDERTVAPLLTHDDALGIVDFVVLPHFGKPKYLPKYEDIIGRHGKTWKLVMLTDEEALIVTAPSEYQKISSPIILQDI